MDTITAVAFEMSPPAVRPGADIGAHVAPPTVYDVAHFNAVYASAHVPQTQQVNQIPSVSRSENDGFRSVFMALQGLNGRAESIGAAAVRIQAQHTSLQPSDILMLTVKAHEFMFHCELTANVANRTSDGVQQLFREQT
jgi:hypothetical protein